LGITCNFDALKRDALENIKQACRYRNIKCYLVGGAVRDSLLKIPPRDIDICLELDPKELLSELDIKEYTYYDAFHTATVTFKNGTEIDLICCRKEKYESEGSLPKVFLGTISEDLKRRDFTVNAIAFDLIEEKLIDPYQGVFDIKAKVITSVHEKSYLEDPTRIFRAIKYSIRYGFIIKDIKEIEDALKQNIFNSISNERYFKEILSICGEEKWKHIFIECNRLGILNLDSSNLSKENFLVDYKDVSMRMLNFAWCLKEEDQLNRIIQNSYINKELKKSLENCINIESLLLKSQDNYYIYSILKNSSVYDRVLLAYNYKLIYKLIYYIRHSGFKLDIDGGIIKNQFKVKGKEIGDIIDYIEKVKLNIGIWDEKKYFNENSEEILNAVKYKT